MTAAAGIGQMAQPCADSAGRSWFAQCPHRSSWPIREARKAARTAGPHRSHVSVMPPPPAAGLRAGR